MLLRLSAIFLIAGSVLVSGCHSPGGPTAKSTTSSRTTAAVSPFPANPGDSSLVALPLDDLASTNRDSNNLIDAHAHYAAGVIHEMNLEPESALEDYYQAAMLDPTNEPLVLDVAQQYLQARRPEKALDLLARASTNGAPSSALFAEMGFVYSKLGKTNEAIAADHAAIQKDPRSLAGYESLFLDFMQNRQTNQALALLDDAGKVKNTDAGFLIGLGELYFRLADELPAQKSNCTARALAVLQRAAKMKPAEPRLQIRLADGLNLGGKTEDAAALYEGVLKGLPDGSPQIDSVHAKLADLYLRNHDFKRASEHLEVILRNNPTDPQTYYLLGNIASEETNYAKAVEYFRNTILFNPDFESGYYELAAAQLGTTNFDGALSTLDRARRKFPRSFRMEELTGAAYNEQKDYTNALKHLTAAEILAQSSEPRSLTEDFYYQVGEVYERAGDYAQAEKYFKECLRLAPDFAEALNYLGYMWADHDLKLDQAHDLIARALKLEPKNGAYLDSMAWVLYKLHQPKPALDYELKAIQHLDEEDATVYDHLGDIYSALGQKDKARDSWKKSLSLEANDSVRKKINSDQNKP